MTREIEFLYDFGSPNAYFVHRALPAIVAGGRVAFRYVPVLLGGIFKAIGNQSPMQTYGHIAAKRDYDFLEMRRFMDRHGIDRFRMNPNFPVNTLLMMRGAVAAEQLGCAADYIETMMIAMWEDGFNMADPAVWAGVLEINKLPWQELSAAVTRDEVKAALVANTEAAVKRGVFGIPTFFLGDEMWFGKDRLRDVVEAASV
ncbi:2-hydroxychromene-2-carboxylate isomerase [Novosphingobium sp.]|uniref:2-hydroxychromene-2-carboxylate isomerase n=1 Tax=Novosphingobium sp. TaxID=1874826 RepID=UPI0025DA0207|nr:2-hydroxychromene-2-carboxylate isomerase [Novosphingobium sp.]MCC6926888.1 2-hydroxychromene-2-carboxylate isomerase [Novosphingobium sp.]